MTLLNESRAVDLQIRWAELALESAQLQYDIAVSETSDGVLTESENEYLFMEAEQAAQKSKNIILRAIEKVIEFIKSVVSKIAEAFSEKKVNKDLEEVKKIQNDPNVKSAKAEVPDWKEAQKNADDYEKAISKFEKKAKSGKVTQADVDELNAAKEKCNTTKKVVIGAAAGAVTLGGLLLGYKARTDSCKSNLKKIKDNLAHDIMNDKSKGLSDDEVNEKYGKLTDAVFDFNKSSSMLDMAKIDLMNIRVKIEPMIAGAYRTCVGAAQSAWSKVSGAAQSAAQTVKNKVSKNNSSNQSAAGQTP